MGDTLYINAALIWVLGSLATAAHFAAYGGKTLRNRLRQTAGVIAWPAFWLFAFGPFSTVRHVVRSAQRWMEHFATVREFIYNEIIGWAYYGGAFFFPAAYVYINYGREALVLVLVKSILWAPFWPVYAYFYGANVCH